MGKFCGLCGGQTDIETGLCPVCDKEELERIKNLPKFCPYCGGKTDQKTGKCPVCDASEPTPSVTVTHELKNTIAPSNTKIIYPTTLTETKPIKKRKKKKIIVISAIILVIAVSLGILIPSVFVPLFKYKRAQKLIEDKEFEKAYEILTELEDYKDAEEVLEKFVWLPEKIVAESEDERFNVTLSFDENGNMTFRKSTYVYKDEDTGENQEAIFQVRYTYDSQNRVTKAVDTKTDSDGNSSETITSTTYDSNDNVTKEVYTRTNSDGEEYSRTTENTYDSNGNLVETSIKTDSDSDGDWSRSNTKNTYNQDNKITQKIYTYTDGSGDKTVTTTYYTYENGRLIREDYSDSMIEYAYDSRGNCTKKHTRHLNSNGKFSSGYLTESEYNSHDKCIKEVTYYIDSYGSKTLQSSYEYEYDSNDNLLRRELNYSSSGYVNSYEYDSNNNCTFENYKSYDEYGNIEYEYTFEYTFSNNKLTKEHVYSYDNDGDNSDVTFEITYDDNGNFVSLKGSGYSEYDGERTSENMTMKISGWKPCYIEDDERREEISKSMSASSSFWNLININL